MTGNLGGSGSGGGGGGGAGAGASIDAGAGPPVAHPRRCNCFVDPDRPALKAVAKKLLCLTGVPEVQLKSVARRAT